MTDFERRLRAAMAAAAGPPPAGLLDGIRQRHRRYVRRAATAGVAAVAAIGIAGTLVTRGILAGPAATGPAGSGPAGSGPAGSGPAVLPPSAAAAAPETARRDCANNNNGTVGSHWQAHSVHAGPVWFIYARPRRTPAAGHRLTAGPVTASAMVIAISNGRSAVVRAAPATAGRFRFLAGFHGGGQPYTLAEGAPRLALSGCPAGPAGAGIPVRYAPGLTMFWQGYVTGLRGCIPLTVRATPAGRPVRVTVAAMGCAAG